MTVLEVERTQGQRTFYKPAVLTVSGVSKYNANQISFHGEDGFWQMSEFAVRDTNGAVPPVGTTALFTLTTNPKRGPNAAPGSMYRDIQHIEKAPPGAQPAAPAQEDPRETWSGSQGQQAQARPAYEDRDTRITRAQAINNRVAVFAAIVGLTDKRLKELNITVEQIAEEHATIQACLLAMDGGNLPNFDELWNSEPNGAEQDAAELDQQAQAHLGEDEQEMSF